MSPYVIISPHRTFNGRLKTRNELISHSLKKGKTLISAHDVYQAGKTASDLVPRDYLDENPGLERLIDKKFDIVRKRLREDFAKNWLVTRTGIIYSENDLSGMITYDLEMEVDPSKRKVIPVYNKVPLPRVLHGGGLGSIQSIFKIRDGPKKIIRTFENLSDREADRITVETPNIHVRNNYSMQVVGFAYGHGYEEEDNDYWFRIFCDYRSDGVKGLSRWTSMSLPNGHSKK